MAQRKTNDQLLRKAFDTVYREVDHIVELDRDEVKVQVQKKVQRASRVNRRALGVSLIVMALAVLVIAGLFGVQALMDHIAWQNRPTFAERLTAPYDMENKYPPYLLNAVTVDAEVNDMLTFKAANIEYYESDEPQASQLMAKVVQLQSILPARIGDFSLQWNRSQSTLLTQCLLAAGAEEQGQCPTVHTAEFVEPANFVDNEGNKVSLVMTKFADAEQSSAMLDSAYHYARRIGRIGNFALTNMLDVDYFYSLTRETTSFTWLNDNWVITVSAKDLDTIDQFMTAFPLYENNPDLSSIVVEQIHKNTAPPVPPADADVAASEAISGTTPVSGTTAVSGTQSE